MQYYWYMLQQLLNFLSPPSDSKSVLMVAFEAQGIASLRIFYTGTEDIIFLSF
jgi:hypothetical protein